ncbi:MAG: hypothetical protein N2662_12710 [Bacteroidales bacterium]|nr:hypothetical protein [Bacteroidales bacterium]
MKTKYGLLIMLALLLYNRIWAATITSAGTGNWSAPTTWVGGVVPGVNDDVIIANGHQITVNVNAFCNTLTINTGATNTSVAVGNNNLSVTGAITINAPTAANIQKYISVVNGTLQAGSITLSATGGDTWDSYILISGTGSVSVAGNISLSPSNLRTYILFTGNGTLNVGGNLTGGGITSAAGGGGAATTGTVNFNGTGAQSISTSGYYDVIFSGSGTKTLGAAITVGRNLSITGTATVDCQQYQITGNATGTLTMGAGTTLIIGSPAVGTANTFPSNYTAANISLDVNSTVIYSADANQNISNLPTYGNLIIRAGNSANRTRTLAGNTVIAGNLTIEGNATYQASLLPAANNITVNGTTTVNNNGVFNDATAGGTNRFDGLVTLNTGSNFINGSTSVTEFRGGIVNNGSFVFNGTGDVYFTTNNQTISGSNAVIINGNIFIQDPVSLTITTSINFTGTNLNINSNANPALNATAGTFSFSVNGAQNITGTGTGSIIFYNLTIAGGNTKTTNRDFTVNNDFSVSGGTFSFGAAQRNIVVNGNLTGSATISMTGAGLAHTLTLNGSNNSFTGTFNTTNGSGSTVIYGGNGDQNIFSNGSTTYQNITLTGGGRKTLANNTTINGVLNLSNGILSLGNFNLTLADGSSVTGTFDNQRMIETNGSGYLQRNSNSLAGYIMVYPVGTGSNYTPVTITAMTATVAAGAYLRVRAVPANAPNSNLTDLNKYWELTSNGLSAINATVSFTYADPAEVNGDQSKYSLVRSNIPASLPWITPANPSPEGSNPLVTTGTNVLQGIWTAKESLKTLYSYQTGNWNVASTWTTDPSGTLSVGASVPTASDRVVILNGRTVNITNNNITVYSVTINNGGILDIGNTTGHDFGNISGQGLIRLSSATMPGGTYDNFVAAGGGTVEYYNAANFNFSQLIYNNLILNLSSSAIVATLIGDMTVNGNLTVSQGIFQINDASTIARNVIINGNVNVASGGSIVLGTGNTNHTVYVRGNFTNNGYVDFYEGVAPDYTGASYATTAHADVIFDKATADQNLYCNGITEFYRIVINKGFDKTYVLNIDASASGLFRLYGRNNQQYYWPENIGETPGSLTNNNALGLLAGTVRIGNNISIPTLATDNGNYGVYSIDQDAALWIDNGQIIHNSASQWFGPIVYGELIVSGSGIFDATNAQNGIVLRGTGLINIQNGTLTTSVLRVSSRDELSTQRGAYRQTGGTVNLTGNANIGNMATFCLPYPNMSFVMSGGVLNIQSSTSAVGNGYNFSVIIAADQSNVSVTGGTVNITVPSGAGRAAYINSSAPFYNLNIVSTNANPAQLQAYAGSATSPVIPAIAIQPLVVLNDFSLNNTAIFNANTQNVTIGRNFTISSAATYTPGTNTTIFNGTGSQSFDVSGTITGNLNNLTLSNTSDLTLYGNNITVLGTLTIGSGCTLRDNGRTITVQGNIVNSGTHFRPVSGAGSIILTGTAAQVLSGNGSGIFNNLTLNKTGGSVTTTADFTITGELRLANTAARLTIGSNRLYLTSTADIYDNTTGTGKNFSNARMIVTNGLASDKGISKDYNSTSAFVFPFGMNVGGTFYYTPASIQFSSAPTTYGTVTSRPVNGRHPLLTGANNAITCYWKTRSTGFAGIPAGSVRHLYYYDFAGSNFFVQGTEANYVPGAYISGSSWTYLNNPALVNDAINEISYNTANDADGEFVAGELTALGSIPTLYSSATPGNWNNAASWSSTAVGGPGGAGVPSPGTMVVIGDGSHNHTITIPAGVNNQVCGSLYIAPGSTLDITTTNGHNFASLPDKGVTGGGTLRIGSNNYFPAGDFGEFIGPNGGTVEYYTVNANITLPNTSASGLALTTYKNLKLTHSGTYTITLPNQDITVYGDVTVAASGTPTGTVRLNTTATRTVTINGNLNINSGVFEFRTPVQTLRVLGNVNVAAGATFQVLNNAAVTHTLEIYGNLTVNGTFDMSVGTGYVNTYFEGTNNATISGSGTMDFYRLYVDKGTNTTPVLRLTSPITVTPATGQLVYLLNGTFRVDNSALTLTLNAANTNFTIPTTACLSVNAGTVQVSYNTGGGAGGGELLLNGKLEVLGGNMVIGNTADNTANDIEYAPAGSPEINVSGGQLIVAGQIRRSTTVTSGSLRYIQSGGTTRIFGNASVATRAKFEVTNTNSLFVMSGGTLSVLNAGGTTYGDIYLVPDSANITGGTFQIGENSSALLQHFDLYFRCPVYGVSIGTPTVEQMAAINVYPLRIQNLTINGNSQFQANGLPVTITGNLTNSNVNSALGIAVGGYQPGSSSQITTFAGTTQTITGVSGNLTNFAQLVISPSTSVSLAANTQLRVNGNLQILSGTLSLGNNFIYLVGDVYNKAITTNTAAVGGISFIGSNTQYISGDGNGIFGNLIVNNSYGATLKDNCTINGRLTLTNGMFYIDDYLLTLGPASSVAGTFSSTRMIMLNGALSDQGVRRLFNAGSSGGWITLPIGVAGKYTPAQYNVTATSLPGSITIRPVNQAHPAVTELTANELKYYWSVDSAGFASDLNISYRFTYVQGDVVATEASYVIGRYNYKTFTWQNLGNAAPYTINTGTNLIQLANVNFVGGDFTVGYAVNFGTVVPLYSRNNRPTNNWSSPSSWTTNPDGSDCSGPNCSGGYSISAPVNNPVKILSGHTILLDANSATAASVNIEGTLDCGTTVYHNLNRVYGTGKIEITSTPAGIFVFPGGDFDEFFDTPNTTLEFKGNNTATLPLKPGNIYKPYQHVIFSGTGRKDITYENLKILGNLTIQNGTVLYNGTYNKDIYALGNWTDNNTSSTGGFVPGTGNVYFQGTTPQTVTITGSSTTIQFYNLHINNSSGVTLSGNGRAMVNNLLYLTLGNITTTSTNLLLISNTSQSAIVGGGASSFVNGPLSKNINNGQSFTFPVGSGTRYGWMRLTNTSVSPSPQYWTVQYVNANPNPTYPTAPANLNNPITDVSNNEYWVVNRPSGGTARVTLRWDANSYPAITPSASLRTRLRVVEYEIATSKWSERGNIISGNATAGTVATAANVTQESYIFTLGLIGVTAGIITPPNSYSICDNGEQASVQVALTGTPPWTLSYQTTGNSITRTFTQSNITSSPYTIQLTSTDMGGYGINPYTLSLTSVSDASLTGVVSPTTVTIQVKLTYTPSISGPSGVGLGETRTYSTPTHSGSTFNWSWVSSSGGSIATPSNASTNITFNTTTGTFQLRVIETSSSGCVASAVVPITVSNTPTPDILPKTLNICQGSTINYSTAYNAGNEYRWTVVNGTCTGCGVFSTNNSISVTWSNTGAVSVTVEERIISNPTISGTNVLNANVSSMPANQTYTVNPICVGDVATIQLNGSQVGVSYQLKNYTDNTDVGSPLNGTGSPLVFNLGALPSTTRYYIRAYNEGCERLIPLAPSYIEQIVNPRPNTGPLYHKSNKP